MSTQQVPARAQRLYALWSRLPSDVMTENALEKAILQVLDRPGAEADASAYRHALVGCEAVKARRGEDGSLRFEKAESFPSWPENGPGTASWDEHLRELAEDEQRLHDRAAEDVLRNSPQNRERAALIALIDERIDARVAELRRAPDGAAVTRARALLRRAEDEGVT